MTESLLQFPINSALKSGFGCFELLENDSTQLKQNKKLWKKLY